MRGHSIIGACDKDSGQEDLHHRREAISIVDLHKEAPNRIHKMLADLAHERNLDFVLTVGDLTAAYANLNVNLAELLGLRLYTGVHVLAAHRSTLA